MEVSDEPASVHNDRPEGSTHCNANIAEIVAETFPAFDHQAIIIEPFDNEAKRDAEFQESKCTHLHHNSLIIEPSVSSILSWCEYGCLSRACEVNQGR